ncbi:hypothetical protein GGF32_007214 [Allomyces javanicus]|nr:hypothetical protein GGF32_007214 [Allomyces javanicus]
MSRMQNDATVLLVAKRRSGKSVLVRDILYHKRNTLRAGIVFNVSEHCAPYYSAFVPDSYIHTTYDGAIVERLLKHQSALLKQAGFNKSYDNSMFIVMDDCLADAKSFKKDQSLRTCLLNGRHFNVFQITCLQYCLGLEPALWSNFDYVCLFLDGNLTLRHKIHENFCGMITFREFMMLMDTLTEDYNCMIIDNTTTSNKVEDKIFFYKAQLNVLRFRVGSPEYWLAHDCMYNCDHDADMNKAAVTKTKKIVSAFAPDHRSVRIVIKSK